MISGLARQQIHQHICVHQLTTAVWTVVIEVEVMSIHVQISSHLLVTILVILLPLLQCISGFVLIRARL
jgi:hypothetical protein